MKLSAKERGVQAMLADQDFRSSPQEPDGENGAESGSNYPAIWKDFEDVLTRRYVQLSASFSEKSDGVLSVYDEKTGLKVVGVKAMRLAYSEMLYLRWRQTNFFES